ncbi:thioredoxin [Halobacillus litoralis]|uniref:thioredoxin n=1 Tax=Halobacillus litoralis TaxID=45668 RepID=UPI0024938490|nr:thioredoxin [Halobacillus litoralis]
MTIQNATDETFVQETSNGLVIADLGAPWCGPCKMIAPVLEDIDQEQGDQMKIVKVDVDENMETAQKYGVMSVPTLLFFKDGELVDQAVGFKSKEEIVSIAQKHV